MTQEKQTKYLDELLPIYHSTSQPEIEVVINLDTGRQTFFPSRDVSKLDFPLGGLERLFGSGAEVVRTEYGTYRKVEDVASYVPRPRYQAIGDYPRLKPMRIKI